MYKCFLFIGIFLFIFSAVFPSNTAKIDSLQVLIQKEKNDTNKVKALNQLGREYMNIGSFDSAIHYSNIALQLSIKLNFQNGMATSYSNKGQIYRVKGNSDKALENDFIALKIREEIGDKKGAARSYNDIGLVYWNQKMYDKGLENEFTALEIFKKISDKQGIANSYSFIGQIYFDLGNYEKALVNHFLALEIRKASADKQGLAGSYNNIGLVYFMEGKLSKQIGDKVKADNYFEKAKEYHLLSLKMKEETGDQMGTANSYVNLGDYYSEIGNYPQAITYFQKGLNLPLKLGIKNILIKAYLGLSEVSEKNNDFRNAYKYHKLYSQIKDSIFNEESSKQIAEMRAKYETEKKDKELTSKQSELEIQKLLLNKRKYQIISIISIFVFISILALLIMHQNRLRSTKKLLLIEQKLLRLQMNPHFIFNALASIQTMIVADSALSVIYLSRFSELMRLILEYSKEDYIPLEKEIKIIEHYLELQKLRFGDQLNYRLEIAEQLDTELIQIPPMLCQPFIENALEHGIKNKDGKGEIIIRFFPVSHLYGSENEILQIEIQDNGIGIIKAKEQNYKVNKSLATTITEERLENFNRRKKSKTTMKIEDLGDLDRRNTGTKVTFIVPIV